MAPSAVPPHAQLLAVNIPEQDAQSDEDAGSALAGSPVTNPLHLLSKRRRGVPPGESVHRSAKKLRSSTTEVPSASAHGIGQAASAAASVCRADLSNVVSSAPSTGRAEGRQQKSAISADQQVGEAATTSQPLPEGTANSPHRQRKQRKKGACFPYGNYHRCGIPAA